MIPSTVVFVAYNGGRDPFQLSVLRKSGITIDFSRIVRLPSVLLDFHEFVFDLSGFEERLLTGRNERVSSQIYLRIIDRALTVVKAILLQGMN